MDIIKESSGGTPEEISAEDLALIQEQSRKELKGEELYTFSVRLCDNELDRDLDRFTRGTLEELAVLFVGKSGIFDHSWTAMGQACRIYRTEVVEDSLDDPLETGEGTCYLKGFAYMVRTAGNQDLIAEIDAGIKKEVSVGCAVAQSRCSICGEDIHLCAHTKGEYYEGKRCYANLVDATDAYEFSFVAVPSQPKAGVLKGYSETQVWKEMVSSVLGGGQENMEECRKALGQLREEAGLGRQCMVEMQACVKRLALLSEEGGSEEVVDSLVKKLSFSELSTMRGMLEKKVEKKYPILTQLDYGMSVHSDSDGAFII